VSMPKRPNCRGQTGSFGLAEKRLRFTLGGQGTDKKKKINDPENKNEGLEFRTILR